MMAILPTALMAPPRMNSHHRTGLIMTCSIMPIQ